MRHYFFVFLVLLQLVSATAFVHADSVNSSGIAPSERVAWLRNAVIYQVNVRNFSESGRLNAVRVALPRLKELGVNTILLMPIHPIGEEKRVGRLGSPYAVRDYLEINPDLGTKADFRDLVREAHKNNMKVMMDWVANHTSWDHVWTREHPDYYLTSADHRFVPPDPMWQDVIDLDYRHVGMRSRMLEVLEYWVREFDIDGYRFDAAPMVPADFWRQARRVLFGVKPVMMFAEARETEKDLLTDCFDALYGWLLHEQIDHVAKGKSSPDTLWQFIRYPADSFPASTAMVNYTSSHDVNAWEGEVFERLGDGAALFAALSVAAPGIPMIYNGQEAGLDRRINFFDKDPIEWRDHPFTQLYEKLFKLRSEHPALLFDGPLRRWTTSANDKVLVFERSHDPDLKDPEEILAMFNLSSAEVEFTLPSWSLDRLYRDVISGQSVNVKKGEKLRLQPWGFLILETGNSATSGT